MCLSHPSDISITTADKKDNAGKNNFVLLRTKSAASVDKREKNGIIKQRE